MDIVMAQCGKVLEYQITNSASVYGKINKITDGNLKRVLTSSLTVCICLFQSIAGFLKWIILFPCNAIALCVYMNSDWFYLNSADHTSSQHLSIYVKSTTCAYIAQVLKLVLFFLRTSVLVTVTAFTVTPCKSMDCESRLLSKLKDESSHSKTIDLKTHMSIYIYLTLTQHYQNKKKNIKKQQASQQWDNWISTGIK